MKRSILRAALAAAFLMLLLVALAAPRVGAWLVREDPLTKADAIYVLGGTVFERPLEARDLYAAGWAPIIVLTQQRADWGELWLAEQGITFESGVKQQVDLLERLGVPRGAVEIIGEQDSTADEADALLELIRLRGWSRVIVVTSKQHTRRAGLAMRRVIGNNGRVVVRASRYDRSDVDRWWANRSTLRFTLFETQRLMAYWVGLAD